MQKMNYSKLSILTILFLSFSSSIITAEKVFNVKRYGASPSKTSDISQALLAAWKDACATPGASKIIIPHAKYNLKPVVLEGPCKGQMAIQIKGTLTAPASDYHGDGWIKITKLDHLTITGGTLDGLGSTAWQKNTCRTNANCKSLPINLRLDFVDNVVIQDLTSRDSKNFHFNLISCNNVTMQRIKIKAPKDSANTDGIHLGRNNKVKILDSKIGTGDDCISIGDGNKDITITGVTCGPGHGISVGSLGKYKKESPVTGVYVKNCTFNNTENGVRIKSWPGAYRNIASDIHFENLKMNNVSNPVLIDQMYCPWGQCNSQTQSNVKLSKISFANIKGTSATPLVVKLLCSKGMPCEQVQLKNVQLTYSGPEGPAKSECLNVKPTISFRTEALKGC